QLGRHGARRQRRRQRGSAHVHGAREARRAEDRQNAVQLQSVQRADESARREPRKRGAAEIQLPRERRRAEHGSGPRPSGRLRRHGQRQKGRVDRLPRDRERGHDALLHLPDPSVDAVEDRGRVGRRRARALAVAGALVLCLAPLATPAPPASARTLDYWVAAVPTSWSIVPNGHDAIMGMPVSLEDSVFPTVVYRRFTPQWRRPLPNAAASSADGLLIPGPLIHARVGDRLRIHFKNLDTLRRDPHSMHFHGVHYRPSSDGAFLPGFSGRDGNVKFGQNYTYKLTAGRDSVGV